MFFLLLFLSFAYLTIYVFLVLVFKQYSIDTVGRWSNNLCKPFWLHYNIAWLFVNPRALISVPPTFIPSSIPSSASRIRSSRCWRSGDNRHLVSLRCPVFQVPNILHLFIIHSLIHTRHLYSAYSRKTTQSCSRLQFDGLEHHPIEMCNTMTCLVHHSGQIFSVNRTIR